MGSLSKLVGVVIFVVVLSIFSQVVHATVYDCDSCSDCSTKIQAGSAGDIVNLNTSITDHFGSCIYFNGADDVTFDCNGFEMGGDGTGIGINMSDNSDNNTVMDCTNMNGFNLGIKVDSSYNITIFNATLRNMTTNGIQVIYTNYANLTKVNSSQMGAQGIWLIGSNYSIVDDIDSSHNQIDGILIQYCNNGTFSNIVANHNNYTSSAVPSSGIRVEQCNENQFYNITTEYNTNAGMSIYSFHGTITARYNNVTNLTSRHNLEHGFRFFSNADSNTIRDSWIENNTISGIYVSDFLGLWIPDSNEIYNTFFNNSQNLNVSSGVTGTTYLNTTQQSGTRIYSSGTDIGGNFWAYPNGTGYSQTCADSEADGICDSSYTAGTNAVDYLPLSSKYHVLELQGCYELNESGWNYTLVNDIDNNGNSTCMNITGNNIVLDCMGKKIDGVYGAGSVSINMSGVDNVTVKNCNISEWYIGAKINSSYGVNFYNNTFDGDRDGISAYNSRYAIINSNVFNIVRYGMYTENMSYSLVKGNALNNGGTAFSIKAGSNNNIFSYNTISTFSSNGLYVYQSYDNVFTDSIITGISGNDLYHFAGTSTMLHNVSLDESKIDVDAGEVYVKWYLDARVLSDTGSAVNNTNVTMKDSDNNTEFSLFSDSSGYITRQNVTEYHKNFTGTFYVNNYSINSTKLGFVGNFSYMEMTSNKIFTIYMTELRTGVTIKTYDTGLAEKEMFNPGRIVRIRAWSTYIPGRNYIADTKITIKNHLGTTMVNSQSMTNISQVTNGYLYEYNYTLPQDAQGLWFINITSSTTLASQMSSSKKIALSPITIQIKLVLNSTGDSVYVPGTGDISFASLTTNEYSTPIHYYIAAYSANVLKSIVFSYMTPISIITEKGSSIYGIGSTQRLSNSEAFVVFSKGNWRNINNRMSIIENGKFLENSEPSFSYGLGEKQPFKILIDYSNIDLNRTMKIQRGFNKLIIEKKESTSGKPNIDISRT